MVSKTEISVKYTMVGADLWSRRLRLRKFMRNVSSNLSYISLPYLLHVKAQSHRVKVKVKAKILCFVYSLMFLACSLKYFALAPTFMWCE